MSNLVKRILTGIVFLLVIFYGLFSGNVGFTILFGVVSALCLWEFGNLAWSKKTKTNNSRRILNLAVGILPFIGMSLACFFIPELSTTVVLAAALVGLSCIFLFELFLYEDAAFQNIAYASLSLVYIGLPFALLPYINLEYSVQVIAGIWILILINDSLAYFWGALIGKTPFFSHISPKKTWEGSVGGGMMVVAASIILSFYFTEIGKFDWGILAIIVVVFGALGDLMVSMIKRKVKIKDTGSLLPGHGGFLDRFDSFIFVMPFALLYLLLM